MIRTIRFPRITRCVNPSRPFWTFIHSVASVAVTVVVLGCVVPVRAQERLAATPPMGWNSWNHFAERVDDKTIRETADAMASTGLRGAGYIYLNIDDTWEGQRDANGVIHASEKCPDMKALADYVHSKGLKLGIYSSPAEDVRSFRGQPGT